MKSFIGEIISKFGGRLAASQQEKQAQIYLADKLKAFTDNVQIQPFKVAVNAKFSLLKLFCGVFYLNLYLFYTQPYIALTLSLINAFLFFGCFVNYRDWLEFLYKKHDSSNVVGTLEPQGEVTSTLMFSGHMDNVREFIWWYHLGTLGALLTMFSGIILMILSPCVQILNCFLIYQGVESIEWANWILMALSPITLTMFQMHGSRIVDGAQDNLSGLACAFEVLKEFADPNQKGKSILQNTRIQMVSFGSEECGTKGSDAYVKMNLNELKKEKAVLINMDGIKNENSFTLFAFELNPYTKVQPDLLKKMDSAFEKSKIPLSIKPLLMGATDACNFQKNNIPALTITSQLTDKLDPTYHTRRDTLENIDPKGLENMMKVLKVFVLDWDRK